MPYNKYKQYHTSLEYSTLNKIQYSEDKSVYEIKIRLSERKKYNKVYWFMIDNANNSTMFLDAGKFKLSGLFSDVRYSI
jgi:hypothetical protein